MKLSRIDVAAIAVTAAQLAAAAYVWRFGQTGPLPMHYGFNGVVNRWGDRNEAALVILAVACATGVIYLTLPLLTQRMGETRERRPSFDAGRWTFLSTLPAVSLLMLATGTGWMNGLPRALTLATLFMSALMLALGVWLGKTEPNPIVGVRTYWSLRSRLAWDKSNRLFGRIAFWGGLAGVAASPFAPQPAGFELVIAVLIASLALSIFESWRVWRTDPDRQRI